MPRGLRTGSCVAVRSLVAVLAGFSCAIAAAAEPGDRVDFDREIRPVLADRCFGCHGPDRGARKAKLRLDRREGVLGQVKSGRPSDSPLLERVSSSDPEQRMPPPESGRRLSVAEVSRIRDWIAQGVRWTRHWSLRPSGNWIGCVAT